MDTETRTPGRHIVRSRRLLQLAALSLVAALLWLRMIEPIDWLLPEDDHFELLFLVALFFGIALGHGQVWFERVRGTWAYLVLRDGGAPAVLRRKRSAAFPILLALVIAPVLLAYLFELARTPATIPVRWERLLELALVGTWCVPAYFIGQWQALSDAGRPGEAGLRLALSIALAGAPFAALIEVERAWFAPGQGFPVLLAAVVGLSLTARRLADRRLRAVPAAARELRRTEAVISIGLSAVCALVLLNQLASRSIKSPGRQSLAPVLANEAGQLANWKHDGDQLELLTSEGEVVAAASSAQETRPHGWSILSSARSSSWSGLANGRGRQPFMLREWEGLGRLWAESGAGARGLRELFRSLPDGTLHHVARTPERTEVVELKAADGGELSIPGELASFSVSLAFDGDPDSNGLGLLLLDPERSRLWLANGTDALVELSLPDGDRPMGMRLELMPRFDGMDPDSRALVVGANDEYAWDAASGQLEPWRPDQPVVQLPTFEALDRSGTLVRVGDVVLERALLPEYSRVSIARIGALALALMRAPILAVPSYLLDDPGRGPLGTLVLDPLLAGRRNAGLLLAQLALGLTLAALAGRHLRGHPHRRGWMVFVAAFGVIGYLLCALETRARKLELAPGRYGLLQRLRPAR